MNPMTHHTMTDSTTELRRALSMKRQMFSYLVGDESRNAAVEGIHVFRFDVGEAVLVCKHVDHTRVPAVKTTHSDMHFELNLSIVKDRNVI